MTVFPQIRPSDGVCFGVIEGHDTDEVERRLGMAEEAWRRWRWCSMDRRVELLGAVVAQLEDREAQLASLMAREMGKPLREGRAEVRKCAWWTTWVTEEGPALLADRPVSVGSDARAYVTRQPMGVVLGVMPWNFPCWQVLRYAAPAILAGNAVLLKHAPNVPGCALALEELFLEAGAPEGLFQTLLVDVDVLTEVVGHPAVRAVTLTGSTAAGRAFGALAGARLLPSVLELGGSDAYIVLEDADVEEAAAICATARLINGGQSCIAAKRLVVVEPVAEAFVEALVAAMGRAVVGDPERMTTTVGPLARADLRDRVAEQVRRTLDAGARCALGGEVPEQPGFWYPPTVLVDVPEEAPAAREEVFGPVAAVLRVADEAEAIQVANRSEYGLGAAVFTADRERGERIAREELEAGCCFVNAFVRSDPRLPFGGIKASGYGRELGPEGIWQFTHTKTVWVQG